MNSKISELEGVSEKVLTVLNLYEIVNIDDFTAILKATDKKTKEDKSDDKKVNGHKNKKYKSEHKEYVSNNIRQLKYRGYINLKKDDNLKLLSITEKGLKRLEGMSNDYHHVYGLDMPLEDRAYNRKLYQRHVRGQLAFIEGGVNATRFNSIELGDKEPVYLDMFRIKKKLGDEVKGSAVTGLLLTPDESYVVYCSEGGFVKIEETEKKLKTRLEKRVLPQSLQRSELKDIVICPSISDINGLLFNRSQVNKQLSNYIAKETDRNKFLMTMEEPDVQALLLTNKEFRDDYINAQLYDALIESSKEDESLKKTLIGLKRISNREFIDCDNGKVVSLLDLNLGLIKKAKIYAMEGQAITLIVLDKYKTYFEDYFKNSDVAFVSISKEDIINLYGNYKEKNSEK